MSDHESQCPDCGCEAHALRADCEYWGAAWEVAAGRLAEIRAVVAEVDAIHPLDFRGIPSVGSVVDRMRAILDREPGRNEEDERG